MTKVRIQTFDDDAEFVGQTPGVQARVSIAVVKRGGQEARLMSSLTEALVHFASDDGNAVYISDQPAIAGPAMDPDGAVIGLEYNGLQEGLVYYRVPILSGPAYQDPELVDLSTDRRSDKQPRIDEVHVDPSCLGTTEMKGHWLA